MSRAVMLLFLITYIIVIYGQSSPYESGPFTVIPLLMGNCSHPSKPLMKKPSVVTHLQIYNVSNHVYFKGNLTLYKAVTRGVQLRSRMYRQENDEWKITNMMTSNVCKGLIVTTFMTAFRIKINKKTCVPQPGSYYFEKIDLNKVEHTWWLTREYGRFLWIIEATTSTASIICTQIETIVIPLKKKTNQQIRRVIAD